MGKNKKKDRQDDGDGEMEEKKKKKKKNAKKNKKTNKSKERKEKKSNKKERKEKRAEKKAKKAARKQERKDSDDGKARGSLSGIATLRRSGAVEITVEEDHKIISSEFTVGPLQLEVSKSFGEAKERQVKTAKASTDVMKGVMVLKVKADGSAHVKKVIFKKPDHVDVSGSL